MDRLGVSEFPEVLHRAQPPEGLLNPLLAVVHEVGLEPSHGLATPIWTIPGGTAPPS